MPVLAVGVTGHRTHDDEAAVSAAVARLADGLVERAGQRSVVLWSSLAEGADRVIADAFVARGATLHVVLPLPPDDYRRDFASAASRAQFDRLLAAAAQVEVAVDAVGEATVDRTAAYEAAGRAMVDAVDVVIAVWDGAPSRGRGGTAEIVEHARDLGREVIVVPVTRGTLGR